MIPAPIVFVVVYLLAVEVCLVAGLLAWLAIELEG